ncbi:GNAT family N-acetyltransferase [Acidiferrobacter thiooxydans]|uniref:GNAT family N-acetyltransferase n=1 Tax=Acidiferrobacter thiooxydans TaxID=163359 RepID=UPI000DF38A67
MMISRPYSRQSPTVSITVMPPFAQGHRTLVYEHWFRIYVLEMSRNLATADFGKQVVSDYLEPNSWIFCATCKGTMVGTFRISFWDKQPLHHYVSLYGLSQYEELKVAVGTRLMVAKDYRRRGIAGTLISRAKCFIDRIENSILIVDCNPPVDRLFESQGFTKYASGACSPEYGDVELLTYRPAAKWETVYG